MFALVIKETGVNRGIRGGSGENMFAPEVDKCEFARKNSSLW